MGAGFERVDERSFLCLSKEWLVEGLADCRWSEERKMDMKEGRARYIGSTREGRGASMGWAAADKRTAFQIQIMGRVGAPNWKRASIDPWARHPVVPRPMDRRSSANEGEQGLRGWDG